MRSQRDKRLKSRRNLREALILMPDAAGSPAVLLFNAKGTKGAKLAKKNWWKAMDRGGLVSCYDFESVLCDLCELCAFALNREDAKAASWSFGQGAETLTEP